jgi:dihydroorotate dehydrogenase (fumarate)
VSEVLAHGLHRFAELRTELAQWLEQHEYHSVTQARGCLNLAHCPDPKVYERVSYLRILNSWRPPPTMRR